MEKLFGKNLKNPENDEYPINKLDEFSFVLIYFSASYCPPS